MLYLKVDLIRLKAKLDTVLRTISSSHWWLLKSIFGFLHRSKESNKASALESSKRLFQSSALLHIKISWQTLYPVVTWESSRSPLPLSAILQSFFWMNLPQEWTPRQDVLCGMQFKEPLCVKRMPLSFWQRTPWKRLKPYQPRWVSWVEVDSSIAMVALSTSKISSAQATNFSWRSRNLH